ncbi:hypothetical protein [Rhodoferax sp.]|nr:hypothetical protein [Rhodoferax sp.]
MNVPDTAAMNQEFTTLVVIEPSNPLACPISASHIANVRWTPASH